MVILVPFVTGVAAGSIVTWSVDRRRVPGWLKFNWLRKKRLENATEAAAAAASDAAAAASDTAAAVSDTAASAST